MHHSKKRVRFDRVGAFLAWAAVILQLILIILNRQASIPETILRFLSFFTILTNTLVALYFTACIFEAKNKPLSFLTHSGAITAITAFIMLVGLVYQLILRGIWEPAGLQWVVDEMLHTLLPAFMLLYWGLFVDEEDLIFLSFKNWLWYPVLYFAWILLRGHLSGFYPYPFVNVNILGYAQVLLNSGLIVLLTLILLLALVVLGRNLTKRKINHKTIS